MLVTHALVVVVLLLHSLLFRILPPLSPRDFHAQTICCSLPIQDPNYDADRSFNTSVPRGGREVENHRLKVVWYTHVVLHTQRDNDDVAHF